MYYHMIQRAQSYSLPQEAHDSVSCRLWKLLKNSSTNLTQSQPGLQTPQIPIQSSGRMLQEQAESTRAPTIQPTGPKGSEHYQHRKPRETWCSCLKMSKLFWLHKGELHNISRCLHCNLLCHVTHTHWDFRRKWNSDSSKQRVWNAAHFTLHRFIVLRNIQLIILQVFAFMCVASM